MGWIFMHNGSCEVHNSRKRFSADLNTREDKSLMPTDAFKAHSHRRSAKLRWGGCQQRTPRHRGHSTCRAAGEAPYGSILRICLLVLSIVSGVTIPFEADAEEPISPVPFNVELDARKLKLGRRLFSDSRLSGDNGVSCSSCHFLDQGLTDGLPISRGLPGNPGSTNTLSLFNVGLSSKLNWDGQILTLEERTHQLVEDKNVMGAKWEDVIALLKDDAGITAAFEEIYEEGLRRETVIDAIAEFEKSLITPNAPFDQYLRGDEKAISEKARAGYQLFKDYGCISCHQGVNVGGNMLQVFGIFGVPDAASRGSKTPGSAENTGIAEDRPVFRVPVLRNVQHTSPYFHDGSVGSLPEAIDIMARYQLGRRISDEDISKIEAFLNSLTGEYKGVPVGDLDENYDRTKLPTKKRVKR